MQPEARLPAAFMYFGQNSAAPLLWAADSSQVTLATQNP